MTTITVMYSCRACDVRDEKLVVPARPSEEPVVRWMEGLVARVGRDHRERHPGCRARRLHDLKIPIENAGWVGGPPIT